MYQHEKNILIKQCAIFVAGPQTLNFSTVMQESAKLVVTLKEI